RKALHRIGKELFPMYLSVQQADILAQNPKTQTPKLAVLKEMHRLYDRILAEQDCVTLKQLQVTGRDLMDIGIPAG
ncbi:MAG TPA: polynucleotide adenylyltransferase, partial [Lachnospiraceae bacterium]|nr:polynucleotide adenylyltransferase [Lachnospiraceae bacterium]